MNMIEKIVYAIFFALAVVMWAYMLMAFVFAFCFGGES